MTSIYTILIILMQIIYKISNEQDENTNSNENNLSI
jgi:hypothetical protein